MSNKRDSQLYNQSQHQMWSNYFKIINLGQSPHSMFKKSKEIPLSRKGKYTLNNEQELRKTEGPSKPRGLIYVGIRQKSQPKKLKEAMMLLILGTLHILWAVRELIKTSRSALIRLNQCQLEDLESSTNQSKNAKTRQISTIMEIINPIKSLRTSATY